MKDEIIKYDTAVLAKEKGFNYLSEYYFWPVEDKRNYILQHKNIDCGELTIEAGYQKGIFQLTIPAPTQSLLQKWLREVHGIHVLVCMDEILWDTFRFKILMDQNEVYDERLKVYDTYESALEFGLVEALKLIK